VRVGGGIIGSYLATHVIRWPLGSPRHILSARPVEPCLVARDLAAALPQRSRPSVPAALK